MEIYTIHADIYNFIFCSEVYCYFKKVVPKLYSRGSIFLKSGLHLVNQRVITKQSCRPLRHVLLGVTKKAYKKGVMGTLRPPPLATPLTG